MRNYKHYKLYLRNPKERWLDYSLSSLPVLLDKLKKDEAFLNRASLFMPIKNEVFIPYNGLSVTKKYSNIIRLIIEHLECRGIWINHITDNHEVINTVQVYGYPEDLELAMNVLNYYVNGILMVEEYLMKECRRIKLNSRRIGKKQLYNTRTKVSNNIKLYIEELEEVLNDTIPLVSPDRKLKITILFRHIYESKRIDFKGYKNLKGPTLKSATCKPGSIHLNRLV
jgi:hypothetical protein